jgi:hypothetical protein
MACKSHYSKSFEYAEIYWNLDLESRLYECVRENLGQQLYKLLTSEQGGADQGHDLYYDIFTEHSNISACYCSVLVIFHYIGDIQTLIFVSNK